MTAITQPWHVEAGPYCEHYVKMRLSGAGLYSNSIHTVRQEVYLGKLFQLAAQFHNFTNANVNVIQWHSHFNHIIATNCIGLTNLESLIVQKL